MREVIILLSGILVAFIVFLIDLFIRKAKAKNAPPIDINDDENDDDVTHVNVNVWKKIVKLVLKKKSDIIVMIISVMMLACLDVLSPFINSKVIEVFFSENPDFSKKWLFIGIYIFIAFAYLIIIFSFIDKAGKVEVSVGYEIRKEAFEKLQTLPFAYYDRTPSGWIMARLTSDSRKLSEIISWGLVDILWAAFTMIGVLVMIFTLNVRLALVVLAVIPLMIVLSFILTRVILKAYRDVRKTNSLITASYNESVLGVKTTKTLCLEEKRDNEFNTLTKKMRKISLTAVVKNSMFWPIVLILGYLGVALTLYVGAGYNLGTFNGMVITVDVLYLFMSYATLFFDPVLNIARVLSELQQAEASAERIISLIETVPEIEDSKEVIEKYGTILNPIRENFEPLEGNIEFKDVCFGYSEKSLVLKHFNLNVKKGMSVALVGHTGAGKSTIINLLCRFYEPTSGQIFIDGVDYKERSLTWLHESLGYILQTPHLFNGTIKENIAYGKPNATMDEIIEASKQAQAYDFIMELPDKFDTNVGEGGTKLSLGERQLISFARAILIDAKILILDEATSSIDTETEFKIKNVINKMMEGRTTFMVAHRLSTVIDADLILVIDDGEVKEQGNHKDLLKLQGIYYNLYKNQFITEEIEKSIKR